MKKRLIITGLFYCLVIAASAQNKNGMEQMLDLSRPGAQHALLGQLAGTWNFQDAKLAFVKGTLVRKPIFNGRFFSVEITGGKLQVPVADGQMKEENYQSLQTEGFDNPRGKFFTTSINNHIGSDIEYQAGTYDAGKKQWTYDYETELVSGQKTQSRRVITLVDSTHYKEEFYEVHEGKATKTRELDYTKQQ